MFGSFRSKVAFDLVRPRKYAFATLEAARGALDLGKREVTIIEFGVAAGAGLLGMCDLARRVTKAPESGSGWWGLIAASECRPTGLSEHPDL